jgi:hypothetical protein
MAKNAAVMCARLEASTCRDKGGSSGIRPATANAAKVAAAAQRVGAPAGEPAPSVSIVSATRNLPEITSTSSSVSPLKYMAAKIGGPRSPSGARRMCSSSSRTARKRLALGLRSW